MKLLKHTFYAVTCILFIISCGTYPLKSDPTNKEEPVVIANEELEYEITIIDPGFTTYLNTIARPTSYYSQNYLQNKNIMYVATWNRRAQNPLNFSTNIYQNIIDYDPAIDYGLEVNYKLYWYFKFAEKKYKMRLDY